MKRILAVLAAAVLLCSGAALADTEKEILFSGTAFGETLEQHLQRGTEVADIQFCNTPQPTRFIVDPAAAMIRWMGGFQEGCAGCFEAGVSMYGPENIGGHNAKRRMWYYYPTAEDYAQMNLKNGIFYGGTYVFEGDPDPAATFEDLKEKLTTIYGKPSAEGADADAIWGPVSLPEDIDRDRAEESLAEGRRQFSVSYVFWRSRANGAELVLARIGDPNMGEYVSLYYVDPKYDAVIMDLYTTNRKTVDSSDITGL